MAGAGPADSVLSKAAGAVGKAAHTIEGVQNQVTQGIMTGNAAMTHNPLNDALAAGLRAGASRFGRGSGEPGERAARVAAGVGEKVRQAREVPISKGGREALQPHDGPTPASGAEPPKDRNRDRGGHQR